MSEQDCTVQVEARGHVLTIGLNRPKKKNAFNIAMLRELSAAYTRLEDDDDLRVGLLYANGGDFTAGLDLAEVGPRVAAGDPLFPADAIDPLDVRRGGETRRRRKPVVVVAQGYCLTIGIELMLAADVCVCAANTVFAQMEVQRGIMPFGGATLRFAQRCGWGSAMKWLLTGDRFDAAEALRIGLVEEVVDEDEVGHRGLALAERIAAQAPLAVQATRANALLAVEEGHGAAVDALMPQARALMASEDAKEGVASFLERRQAKFQGR